MRKRLRFLAALVIIINITTVVVGVETESVNNKRVTMQKKDRLEKIRETGRLTVLSPNEEPYSYKDPRNGSFRGIDADIIGEIAKRLGAEEVTVRYTAFSNVLGELVNNPEIDLLAQGIYVTDERKSLVDFTMPIYTEQDKVLTREDAGINSKEDLKNKNIGVIGGTVYETIAKEWKRRGMLKGYTTFFDYNSLQAALENKIVDAILIDSIMAEYSTLIKPKSGLKILSPSQYKHELELNVGYPLKKEDITLLNAFNEKIEEMKKDGSLYQIMNEYGAGGHYIQ